MVQSSSTWGFTRAFVANQKRVYILAQLPELENQGIHLTEVLRWTGDWGGYRIEWPCIALCGTNLPEPSLLCLGLEGRIHIATPSGFIEEYIDNSNKGPASRGMLRDIRLIGDHIYVVGMDRQVYRRESLGKWFRIDHGMIISPKSLKVTGFNSIDGFNENNIYTAGWGGEIWMYNGQIWEQLPSPTNLRLQCIHCVNPNTVFVCGQIGILLKGYGDKWEIIEHGITKDPFWGMEWFQEKLWLATHDAVYCMDQNFNFNKVDFGLGEEPVSCGWLQANSEIMWSVGGKHLLSTTDGNIWTQYFVP
jgi:hypothetical protein